MKNYILAGIFLLGSTISHAVAFGDVDVMGKVYVDEMQVSTVGRVGSIWFIDGTSMTTAVAGGGGAGSLSVGGGSLQDYTQVSSPTSHINFATGAFVVQLISPTTAFIGIDYSSFTMQGQVSAGAGAITASDWATHITTADSTDVNLYTAINSTNSAFQTHNATDTIGTGDWNVLTATTIGRNEFNVLNTTLSVVISSHNVSIAQLSQSTSTNRETSIRRCLKGSVGTINAGQAVYITGWNVGNGVAEVELADADGAGTYPAIGIAAQSITNSAIGNVVVSGRITNLDTSGFAADNDPVYLSATAGGLATAKPTGANDCVQKLGLVVNVNPALGVIDVIGAGRCNDVQNLVYNHMSSASATDVALYTAINSSNTAFRTHAATDTVGPGDFNTAITTANTKFDALALAVSTSQAETKARSIPIIFQNNGTDLSTATVVNCGANITCSNVGSTITIAGLAGGGGGGGGAFTFDPVNKNVAFSTISFPGADFTTDGSASTVTYMARIFSTWTAFNNHASTAQAVGISTQNIQSYVTAAFSTHSTTDVNLYAAILATFTALTVHTATDTVGAGDFATHITTADSTDVNLYTAILATFTALTIHTATDTVGAGDFATHITTADSTDVALYASILSTYTAYLNHAATDTIGAGDFNTAITSANTKFDDLALALSTSQAETEARSIPVIFQDEGSDLSTGTVVDCVGAGITCSNVGSTITITVPGGGGISAADFNVHVTTGDSTDVALYASILSTYTALTVHTATDTVGPADFTAHITTGDALDSALNVSTSNLLIAMTTHYFGVILDSPTVVSDEVWPVMYGYQITITSVSLDCSSGTSVTGGLYKFSSPNLVDATALFSADQTITCGTHKFVTSISNNPIAIGNRIGWFTTSVSGNVRRLAVHVTYRRNDLNQ